MRTLLPLAVAFATGVAGSQTPTRLANINTPSTPVGSDPREFTALGNQWLFSARTPSAGRELWSTDGTAAGTQLLVDIVPGAASSDVEKLLSVNGRVVFFADNRFWATDGTAVGTVSLAAIEPVSYPDNWAQNRSTVLFSARDLASGDVELWRTNGTAAGTARVQDIEVGPGSSSPRDLHVVEWFDVVTGRPEIRTFFSAWTSTHGRELWRASVGGAERLTDVAAGPLDGVVARRLAHHGPLVPSFFSQGVTVWFVADDPVAGVELYSWFEPFGGGTPSYGLAVDLEVGSVGADPDELTARGNTVVFAATTSRSGRELWMTDAFSGQVFQLTDLAPGAASADPHGLYSAAALDPFNQPILFVADDGVTGDEPYRLDLFSVAPLADIHTSGSSAPRFLAQSDAHVYFSADTGLGATGRELWRTDGLTAQLVYDVRPGLGLLTSSNPDHAVVMSTTPGAETVLFAARGVDPLGIEPHVYREGGTSSVLADLAQGADPGSDPGPYWETPTGDLWFMATEPATGRELWRTDGTAAGTALLANLSFLGSSPIDEVVFTADWRAFFANTGAAGLELWTASAAGTGFALYADVNPGPGSSDPQHLTPVGRNIAYSADDGTNGREFYFNQQLYDINPGPGSSNPAHFTVVGNNLFFTADDGTNGEELWVLHWRAPRFSPALLFLGDLRPGPQGSAPRTLIGYRNVLYFTADDGTAGRELWTSGGFPSGTQLVRDINPGGADGIPGEMVTTGPRLYFAADDGATGLELWRSNGTAPGTVQIADLRPGPLGSDPREITRLHIDRVAFVADDGVAGEELWWASLGAPTLLDLVPGPGSSSPRGLFFSSDDLYFTADEPGVGREPWIVETLFLQNPHRIADLAPGPASSSSGDARFGVAQHSMVFNADDGVTGTEPWSLPADAVARRFGTGCGGYDRRPDLYATAPHIGGNVQFDGSGSGNLPGTTALFYISTRPLLPAPLQGGCTLQLDLGTFLQFGSAPAITNYNAVLPIPLVSSYIGANLRVQALVFPSDDPFFGFDTSPAIELRLGL